MSNGLSVDTSAMNARGQATVASAEDFATELNNLRNQVENLMSIWHGESANEFNNAYEKQAENFAKFQKLLDDLGGSISEGAGILSRAEEDNIAAAKQLDAD